jgi:hypothetical protein
MNEVHVRMEPTEIRAPENVQESRTIDFVISTASKDSHRTVLNQSNWKLDRYNRNGIVGYQHNVHGGAMCAEPNPDYVIGKATAMPEQDPNRAGKMRLVSTATFEPREINELADKIFKKVLFGSLSATSVGVLFTQDEKGNYGAYGVDEEAKGKPNETFYVYGQELLEWSIVNIPSNPETVKRQFYNDMRAGIAYVRRVLPELSTRDIMNMTVRDVLAELDGNKDVLPFEDTTRAEINSTLVNYVREIMR